MTKKQKEKQMWIFGIIAVLVIYLLTRKKTTTRVATIRYTATGSITNEELAGMYKDLMKDTSRAYVTDESLGIIDLPWQLDLASLTKDYGAVKKIYEKYYGGNLTMDLIAWMNPIELSQFVAALLKNNQVLFE